jgi:hypothetical protein
MGDSVELNLLVSGYNGYLICSFYHSSLGGVANFWNASSGCLIRVREHIFIQVFFYYGLRVSFRISLVSLCSLYNLIVYYNSQ